ncbi:MAG: hypothetical protein Q8J78_16735 [Moraxellaceae bacterium]|nr:hypothetical protein [Moraxellaceae bacterium]
MFVRLLSVLFLLPLPVLASEVADRERLASELLQLTGTAAVFDVADVRRALADPVLHLGRPREQLVAAAGLKIWTAPRIWLLQADGERWRGVGTDPDVLAVVHERGLVLTMLPQLPSAEALLSGLQPGSDSPALPGLLAAHQADALVLLRGTSWALWQPGMTAQGREASAAQALAAAAEALGVRQQWPEAAGRALVQVDGVADIATVLAVQTALQSLPGARQVQLVRSRGHSVWFALSAPMGEALRRALDADPRLPVLRPASGLPASFVDARHRGSSLLARRWNAETTSPVQSLP